MTLLLKGMPDSVAAPIVAVGWALVEFLGQGFLIGLVVAGLLRLLKSRSADLRYSVACLGLAVMAACPIWTTARLLAGTRGDSSTILASEFSKGSAALAIKPQAPDETRPSASNSRVVLSFAATAPIQASSRQIGWRDWIEPALPAIVALWLVGVGVMALRLVLGFVEVRRLTRRGVYPLPGDLRIIVDRLIERSGLRRSASWLLSQRTETPAVVGWIRPTILIPLRGMACLTVRQFEAVLAHELAHIRRHDYLVNLVQVASETVLFFHPSVWWVSGRIRVERENCCDDWAAELCGDRVLEARALFALEEERGKASLRLAANGASLKDRVRRLLVAESSTRRRADAGWMGGGLIVGLIGIVASLLLVGSTKARDDAPLKQGEATIRGRVLDETGRPIPGARVRLYRRENHWVRHNPMIEETKAGSDGGFQLKSPLTPRTPEQTSNLPPYVILADHPGKAVDWRIVPIKATRFEGDVILMPPTSRTITVVDAEGKPVPGAKVVAQALGFQTSQVESNREFLLVRPSDGPLTSFTNEEGQARFSQLPATTVAFVATKPGFAEAQASEEQKPVRLTPSALLSGKVVGPTGEPLPGIKLVLRAGFMWDFEYAVTDANGIYRFDDLRPRGWSMSEWKPGQEGDGSYKLWLKDKQFVIKPVAFALEPNTHTTLDIRAQKAGVIRVLVVEEGTKKPVAGVRLTGFEPEVGEDGRFSAYTDANGRATFYSVPTRIKFLIDELPAGVFIRSNLEDHPGGHAEFDFAGGETEVTLTIPPISGRCVDVFGICSLPGDGPVKHATVYPVSDVSSVLVQGGRVDPAGHFVLRNVPAGERIHIYAETLDKKFAGIFEFQGIRDSDPDVQLKVPLAPTVEVERILKDSQGNPLALKKFRVTLKIGDKEFRTLPWTLESDAEGRVRFHGIVPGASYQIREIQPPKPGPRVAAGEVLRDAGQVYDEVLVLAPEEKKK